MPYIIMFVIIIVAAGALLLFREPVQAPELEPEEVRTEEATTNQNVPEGFTPPTTPPPSANPGDEESTIEAEGSVDLELEANPEAVLNETPESAASETYVAEASYFTPRRTEHEMEITFVLEGETVTDVNVDYDGGVAATPSHSSFDAAYKAEVIGQNINEIELSRTGGASLTSVAFNEAVAEIRAQI